MSTGEAAAQPGVARKTIRYSEDFGLVGPAPRTGNAYAANDVHILRLCAACPLARIQRERVSPTA